MCIFVHSVIYFYPIAWENQRKTGLLALGIAQLWHITHLAGYLCYHFCINMSEQHQ